MVKSDNEVPCKYVSASPLAQSFVEIMPWTAKQHLWKSKAKEGHQLSRGGPSNRQINDMKNCVTRYVVPCSVNFKIKWLAKTTCPKYG